MLSAIVLSSTGRILDVLSVGDEEAASLGLNVRRSRLVIVVAATVGSAAAVAVSGLIGFVGIIVPAHDSTPGILQLQGDRAPVADGRRRVSGAR